MRALLTINIFVIFMLLRGVSVAKGTLVNRTIDDAWGDSITGASPVYFPDGGFAQGSVCRTCNISPKLVDISKVFDGTWHDTTHHSGDATQVITATFTGTAVYVFNIIANTVPFTTTLTNLTFTLDGELVGHYVHSPDSSSDILYNVLVYSNASLMNTQHTIEMRPTGPFSSLILFDYIAYTVDEDAGSKPSSTIAPTSNSMIVPSTPNAQDPASILPPRTLRPLGAIIGAVVGGLCAVFLGIAALFCWRRQCAKRHGILLDAFQEPSPLRYPPLADMGLYNSAVVSTLSAPISAAQDMSQPIRPHSLVPSLAPTQHSRRYIELNQRLHALENQIGDPRPGPSVAGTGSSGATRSTASSRRTGRLIGEELLALRNEVAEVRALLEEERQLSMEMFAAYRS